MTPPSFPVFDPVRRGALCPLLASDPRRFTKEPCFYGYHGDRYTHCYGQGIIPSQALGCGALLPFHVAAAALFTTKCSSIGSNPARRSCGVTVQLPLTPLDRTYARISQEKMGEHWSSNQGHSGKITTVACLCYKMTAWSSTSNYVRNSTKHYSLRAGYLNLNPDLCFRVQKNRTKQPIPITHSTLVIQTHSNVHVNNNSFLYRRTGHMVYHGVVLSSVQQPGLKKKLTFSPLVHVSYYVREGTFIITGMHG